jgi:calcineurin-like phosphoesterase
MCILQKQGKLGRHNIGRYLGLCGIHAITNGNHWWDSKDDQEGY